MLTEMTMIQGQKWIEKLEELSLEIKEAAGNDEQDAVMLLTLSELVDRAFDEAEGLIYG